MTANVHFYDTRGHRDRDKEALVRQFSVIYCSPQHFWSRPTICGKAMLTGVLQMPYRIMRTFNRGRLGPLRSCPIGSERPASDRAPDNSSSANGAKFLRRQARRAMIESQLRTPAPENMTTGMQQNRAAPMSLFTVGRDDCGVLRGERTITPRPHPFDITGRQTHPSTGRNTSHVPERTPHAYAA